MEINEKLQANSLQIQCSWQNEHWWIKERMVFSNKWLTCCESLSVNSKIGSEVKPHNKSKKFGYWTCTVGHTYFFLCIKLCGIFSFYVLNLLCETICILSSLFSLFAECFQWVLRFMESYFTAQHYITELNAAHGDEYRWSGEDTFPMLSAPLLYLRGIL